MTSGTDIVNLLVPATIGKFPASLLDPEVAYLATRNGGVVSLG